MAGSSICEQVDFDLHGFVGIRLIDAAPSDVAAVRRQLGLPAVELGRTPDIVCRFVDRLALHGTLRRIGRDEAGFTDDAYLILRARHKSRARVQMPMADVGSRCEIVCERGVSAVPLLIAVIAVTALAKGYAPLHATAFTYDGLGVLVTGWTKGGKTETLLAFMEHGARYIGDEWIYVSPDGSRMFGIPEPMRIWEYQLAAIPSYRSATSGRERLRLASLMTGVRAGAAAGAATRRTPLGGLLRRGVPILEQQTWVQIPPSRLFGPDRCDLAGPLDRVVFGQTTEDESVTVEPVDVDYVARRAAVSVEFELGDLLRHYQRFRFAFPEGTNPLLDSIRTRSLEVTRNALRGKGAFILHHPFPSPIPSIYAELQPCLR